MRYEADYNEQLAMITRAIRFANSRPEKDNAREWAARQYRLLKVLPPRSQYVIDNLGKVYGRKGKEIVTIAEASKRAVPSRCEKWWRRLTVILDDICRDASVIPDSVRPRTRVVRKCASAIKDENIPRECWQRNMIQGHRVETTSQNLVVPTIDSFVELIATLAVSRRWRGRISKCVQCQQFFLTSKRKGGRRPRVCGAECATKRGDPTRAKRQQKWRERKRQSVI
jgi:hypothetical protein